MPEFFAEVEEVKGCINEIKQATDKINEICGKAAFAATSGEEKALSEELEPVQKRANARAQQASRILKRQSAETKQMSADKQNEKRVRTHLQETLTRTFKDAIKRYLAAQQKYKEDIKTKVERQVRHVVPDATDEQIDHIVETGEADSVIRRAILDVAADPIQEAYHAATDRLDDVQKLERSVREIAQMFQDMALLVEAQGDMLDEIQHQVGQAKNHVDSGNKELVKALKHQTSLRKKKCCLLIILLVVLLIFTLGIFFLTK